MLASRHLGVPFGEPATVPEPRRGGGDAGPCRLGVAGTGPVHLQQPDVGERVAERADLPVEHGDDVAVGRRPCSCRAGSRRGRSWPGPARGSRSSSSVVDLVDRRQFAGLALVPLAVPALELAVDVARRAGRGRRARRASRSTAWMAAIVSTIDPLARRRAGLGRGRLRPRSVANDVAVDEAHDVERRVVDRRVVGVHPERRRHGHGGMLQAGQDPVLATHVVGARQHVTERWTAQHERVPVGTGDAIREVRVAAGDGVELERCRGRRRRSRRAIR